MIPMHFKNTTVRRVQMICLFRWAEKYKKEKEDTRSHS